MLQLRQKRNRKVQDEWVSWISRLNALEQRGQKRQRSWGRSMCDNDAAQRTETMEDNRNETVQISVQLSGEAKAARLRPCVTISLQQGKRRNPPHYRQRVFSGPGAAIKEVWVVVQSRCKWWLWRGPLREGHTLLWMLLQGTQVWSYRRSPLLSCALRRNHS